MDGISSRKLTWGICIAGIAIAIISFFFLPEIIPVHFAGNGVADDFGNKIEIFLMPILLLTVTILSGIKSIKYVLMHSKTWLTVGQYNLMIDCVLGIILIAEIFLIYIYCFDDGRIHLCEYEETESYRVTEMFINNRQMLLDKLLTD